MRKAVAQLGSEHDLSTQQHHDTWWLTRPSHDEFSLTEETWLWATEAEPRGNWQVTEQRAQT